MHRKNLNVDSRLEKRGGTVPNGQILADWQTYLSYVTTVNDTPYTVTTIANLPLTYYGPSIPLGDGWTYGGLTSPTGTDQLAPPMTSTTDEMPITATDTIPPPSSTLTSGTTFTDSPTSPSAIASSSSMSPNAQPTSSSDSRPTPSSSSSTLPSQTTFLSSTPSSIGMSGSITASAPPQTSIPTESPPESHRNLLAPLLGALIPLVVAILVISIFLCIYHKDRHSRDSRFFDIFSKSKWSSVPSGPNEATSKGKSRELGENQNLFGIKSPTEKSALLTGWTAQHHRRSSSIDDRRDEAEVDEELRNLGNQNNSLLQRLNLGLGWFATPSNSDSNSSSSSRRGNRITSGNTLEKGQGRRVFSPSTMVTAAAAGLLGFTKKRRKVAALTGSRSGSSGSNDGYERVLEDDQLFFTVPKRNTNEGTSTGSYSRSRTGSPATATHQPIFQGYSTHQRSSDEDSRGRLSAPAEITTFSVGIPETPGTDAPDLSLDMTEMGVEGPRRARWSEDGERMRFPVPPGASLGLYDDNTFGRPPRIGEMSEGWNRDSYLSGDTDYYSAPSHQSSINSPGGGVPFPRDTAEYRHVSVSAFGSHPSTPTRQTRFNQPTSSSSIHHSSLRNESPVRRGSPLAPSPSKPRPTSQRPISGIGNTFHSIRNLFSSTPTPSPGIQGESQGNNENRNKRTSYIGQPMVDGTLMSVNRSLDEFGAPLRQGALTAPTIISPRPSHSSERASLHLSIPSPNYQSPFNSHSSHSTSNSSTNDATEASDEPVLRGKRSKGMLLRTSKIGELHRPQPQPQSQPRPQPTPLQSPTGENRLPSWEGDIHEFMAKGEELPPLTPDREIMRDKGMRGSWLGK
ncbi:uncharacterized protein L201_002528 [Kwoniella dendrophila CBS 6074]|uniref:Uncharacterized protein n=1 Tax=Kwoniella dendrophila CBS 6074 TaxID=1295534 RepID=A0AAX4JRV1_9TREE